MSDDYGTFLERKTQLASGGGFEPIEIPDFLFPFQENLVDWAIRRGRAAIFSDCGTGKTPMQLVWADNVVRHSGKPVLILTPLAVGWQTVRESEKFGIEAVQSRDGTVGPHITVTNYQQLQHFKPDDFAGCVCDESSILKNFDGKTRAAITEFMRTIPYRLLCTATAAPNDYIELGTSAEAIGEMGYMDMLTRWFRDERKTERKSYVHAFARQAKKVMRSHGEHDFWRWVCSWARACRKPSDLGFDDAGYDLPGESVKEHIVTTKKIKPGYLFPVVAETLADQREERRRTIEERCEHVARLLSHDRPAVAWCHLNDEGDMLARMIPGSVQVSGDDADERKEEVFIAFAKGEIRCLVTKPQIAGFGLNWQHCAHMSFFPSHSFEQYYQCKRRCLRFGQESVVKIDIVSSEGEAGVIANLQRKADQADIMFTKLVSLMHDHLSINNSVQFTSRQEIPSWLS